MNGFRVKQNPYKTYLPTDTTGKIFHNQSVFCSCWWTISGTKLSIVKHHLTTNIYKQNRIKNVSKDKLSVTETSAPKDGNKHHVKKIRSKTMPMWATRVVKCYFFRLQIKYLTF